MRTEADTAAWSDRLAACPRRGGVPAGRRLGDGGARRGPSGDSRGGNGRGRGGERSLDHLGRELPAVAGGLPEVVVRQGVGELVPEDGPVEARDHDRALAPGK